MKTLGLMTAALLLLTAGCGGNDDAAASTGDEGALREAVQAYSDAYLTGDADKAYGLLSDRCQERIGKEVFAGVVDAAEGRYGTALPIKSFEADVNDDQARATYTYEVSAIDQRDQPWVDEGGWKYDAC